MWEVLLRQPTDCDASTTTVPIFRPPATRPLQDNTRSNLWLLREHPHISFSTYRKLISIRLDCFCIHTTHTGHYELHHRQIQQHSTEV